MPTNDALKKLIESLPEPEAAAEAPRAPKARLKAPSFDRPVTGEYDSPRDGGRRRHNALDLGYEDGTPLSLNRGGRVVEVGEDRKAGRFVKIDHGDGVVSSHSHLREARVAAGDEIGPDEIFAVSGKSATDRPHLHFVTRRNGARVDPRSTDVRPKAGGRERAAAAPADSPLRAMFESLPEPEDRHDPALFENLPEPDGAPVAAEPFPPTAPPPNPQGAVGAERAAGSPPPTEAALPSQIVSGNLPLPPSQGREVRPFGSTDANSFDAFLRTGQVGADKQDRETSDFVRPRDLPDFEGSLLVSPPQTRTENAQPLVNGRDNIPRNYQRPAVTSRVIEDEAALELPAEVPLEDRSASSPRAASERPGLPEQGAWIPVAPSDGPADVSRKVLEDLARKAQLSPAESAEFVARWADKTRLSTPQDFEAYRAEGRMPVQFGPHWAPVVDDLRGYEERARAALEAEALTGRMATRRQLDPAGVMAPEFSRADEDQAARLASEDVGEILGREGSAAGEMRRRERVDGMGAGEYAGRLGAEALRGARDVGAGLMRGVGVAGEAAGDLADLALGTGDYDAERDSLFYNLGERLERALGEDRDVAPEFAAKVARGAGSSVPFFLLGALGAPAVAAGGALTQAGDAYSELADRGVEGGSRLAGALASAPLGATEMFGVGGQLQRLSGGLFVRSFARFLEHTGKEATEEALQEFFQTYAGRNVVEVAASKDPTLSGRLAEVFTLARQGKALREAGGAAAIAGPVGALFGAAGGAGAALSEAAGGTRDGGRPGNPGGRADDLPDLTDGPQAAGRQDVAETTGDPTLDAVAAGYDARRPAPATVAPSGAATSSEVIPTASAQGGQRSRDSQKSEPAPEGAGFLTGGAEGAPAPVAQNTAAAGTAFRPAPDGALTFEPKPLPRSGRPAFDPAHAVPVRADGGALTPVTPYPLTRAQARLLAEGGENPDQFFAAVGADGSVAIVHDGSVAWPGGGEAASAPVPESPETLAAQFASAADPASPRAAVLVTPGEAAPQVKGFSSIPLGEAGTLRLNRKKAKALGLDSPEKVGAYLKENGFEPLIGKVAPVPDTSRGVAVRTEDAAGRELSTSVVPTPEAAGAQAAMDRAQFPQAAAQELLPAQEAVAKRLEGAGAARGQETGADNFLEVDVQDLRDVEGLYYALRGALGTHQALDPVLDSYLAGEIDDREAVRQLGLAVRAEGYDALGFTGSDGKFHTLPLVERDAAPEVAGPVGGPQVGIEKEKTDTYLPSPPAGGVVEPAPQYSHADFGLVTEAENQAGVGQGRVRVIDEEGAEHIIQRPSGRGEGNRLAVPVRRRGLLIKPKVTAVEVSRGEAAAPTSPAGTLAATTVQREAAGASDNSSEWRRFPEETGTLNVPRASMPQIKGEHRGALVQFLKGRGVAHRREEVAPNTLKPSQAEYSPAKVEKAKGFEGPRRSILVSGDGYVVDGHHQWLSSLETAPDEPIPVIRLDAPVQQVLLEAARFPSSGVDESSEGGPATGEEKISPRNENHTPAPALQGSQKGPDFGKGLTRSYRAGMNQAEVTFASQEQRDLYDYAANIAPARNSGRNPRPRSAGFADIERRVKNLGLSEAELLKRAFDVRDDVRAQMRGVKDGESRVVVDNAGGKVKPAAEQEQTAAGASVVDDGASVARPAGTVVGRRARVGKREGTVQREYTSTEGVESLDILFDGRSKPTPVRRAAAEVVEEAEPAARPEKGETPAETVARLNSEIVAIRRRITSANDAVNNYRKGQTPRINEQLTGEGLAEIERLTQQIFDTEDAHDKKPAPEGFNDEQVRLGRALNRIGYNPDERHDGAHELITETVRRALTPQASVGGPIRLSEATVKLKRWGFGSLPDFARKYNEAAKIERAAAVDAAMERIAADDKAEREELTQNSVKPAKDETPFDRFQRLRAEFNSRGGDLLTKRGTNGASRYAATLGKQSREVDLDGAEAMLAEPATRKGSESEAGELMNFSRTQRLKIGDIVQRKTYAGEWETVRITHGSRGGDGNETYAFGRLDGTQGGGRLHFHADYFRPVPASAGEDLESQIARDVAVYVNRTGDRDVVSVAEALDIDVESARDALAALPAGKPAAGVTSTFSDAERAALDRLRAKFRGEADPNKLPSATPFGNDDLIDAAVVAAALVKAGVRRAADVGRQLAEMVGEAVRPYLDQIWDGALVELESQGVDTADLEQEFPAVEEDTEEKATGEPEVLKPGTDRLMRAIRRRLDAGETISWRDLDRMADESFGGSRAEGRYEPKDMYDAMEAAVAAHIVESHERGATSPGRARGSLARMRRLVAQLPTQTTRTEEQIKFQQFSTPPPIGYVAAVAAGIREGETMAEPSAGTGLLAAWGRVEGARVHVNEITPRRRALLGLLGGFETVTGVDAQFLNSLLPEEIRPTLVLMNPPFSSTGGRTKANKTAYGNEHVTDALERLEEGGRLVAVMGEGVNFNRQSQIGFWRELMARYNVRANVAIPAGEFKTYGTSVGTQLVVIDKTGPTPGSDFSERLESVVSVAPDSLEGVLDAILPIANDRPEPGSRVGAGEGDSGRDDRAGAEDGRGAGGDDGSRRPGAGAPQTGAARPRQGRPAPAAAGPDPQTARPRPDRRGEQETDSLGGARPVRHDVTAGGLSFGRDTRRREADDNTFAKYRPAKLRGGQEHPGNIVESQTMAAVDPPDITYRPNLPPEVVSKGWLSDIQLERVTYAGQRHETRLPSGNRAAYFIGDGTGVGKGRTGAGIAIDNWNQGRRRVLWLSVNYDLVPSARRDVKALFGIAQDDTQTPMPVPVKSFDEIKSGAEIDMAMRGDPKKGVTAQRAGKDGILFASYATLIREPRFQAIKQWLGDDGVIIFDEAHKAKNAAAGGRQKASQTALRVLQLQDGEHSKKDWRVVYMSATGATDVRNMAYMTRLGLWGPGTPFPDFADFHAMVEGGGVGMMEMVSREMKAAGMYGAVQLSMRGVTYRELNHELFPEQVEIYDAAAQGWQRVLGNISEALDVVAPNARDKAASMQMFYGTQQRFFRQLLTAMKVPALIEDVERTLAEGSTYIDPETGGERVEKASVIVKLIGTGESRARDEVQKAVAEGRSLDDLDFSPKETLLAMVRAAFPVNRYTDATDSSGNTIRVRVLNERGEPVKDPKMVAARDRLLRELESKLALPENPLDQIINYVGPDRVAEITGREKRIVVNQETGEKKYVPRAEKGVSSEMASQHEMNAFQDGRKNVAIISAAAGTGISLHADLKAKNQRRRAFYTLETGWSADEELQAMGRPHRTNQRIEPEMVLLATSAGGEKRFLSTIAKRLASMGALTRGDRSASGGNLAKYDFESVYGEAAARRLIERAAAGAAPEGWPDSFKGGSYSPLEVLAQMGIAVRDGGALTVPQKTLEEMTVTRFLNRLLALEVDVQNFMFDHFIDLFERAIEAAKAAGRFDDGVHRIKGRSIRAAEAPKVVNKVAATGAETVLYSLDVEEATSPVPLDDVTAWERDGRGRSGRSNTFWQQKNSKNVVFVREAQRTDPATGSVFYDFRAYRPGGAQSGLIPYADLTEKYERVEAGETVGVEPATKERPTPRRMTVREWWNAEYEADPGFRTKRVHILGGSILPVWDRVRATLSAGGEPIRAVLAETDEGERVIGAQVPPSRLRALLRQLGVSQSAKSPEDVFDLVLNGGQEVELAGGVRLVRSRLRGRPAIQLQGVNLRPLISDAGLLGLINELISYRPTLFVPTDERAGVEALGKLLERHPAMAAESGAGGPDAATSENFIPANREEYEALKAQIFTKAKRVWREIGRPGVFNSNVAYPAELVAELLPDLARIGAYHLREIGRTVKDVTEEQARRLFAKRMVADLGAGVRPHLGRVYDESKKLIEGGANEREDSTDEAGSRGDVAAADTGAPQPVGAEGDAGGQFAGSADTDRAAGREEVSDGGRRDSGVPRIGDGAGVQRRRAFPQTLEAADLEGGDDRTYSVQTNRASLEEADRLIAEKGPDGAAEYLRSREDLGAEDVALAYRLLERLDGERAVTVAADISRKLTRAGQAVQAAQIVARLSPERVAVVASRIADEAGTVVKPEDLARLKRLAARALEEEERADDLERKVANLQAQLRRAKEEKPEKERKRRVVPTTPAAVRATALSKRLAQLEREARARLAARKDMGLKADPGGERGASPVPLDIADWAIIGAAKLARLGLDFAAWSAEMAEDLGDEVRPYLRLVYVRSLEVLREERAALRLERLRREAVRSAVTEETTQEEIDALLEDSDEMARLMRDAEDARSARASARAELARALSELDPPHPADRLLGVLAALWNLPRSLKSTADLSALGRQGYLAALADFDAGRAGARETAETLLRGFSEERFARFVERLRAHARYRDAVRSRLFLASREHSSEGVVTLRAMMRREEAFASPWAERIPLLGRWVVKPSERAYVATLDAARLTLFSNLADEIDAKGLTDGQRKRAYEYAAKKVNHLTGRGTLGESDTLGGLAVFVNGVFFAPRFMLSRFQALASPAGLALAPAGTKLPAARKMGRVLAIHGLALLALALAGFDVEWDDFEDGDWMKARRGDDVYDINAGLQQPARAALRSAARAVRTMGGRRRGPKSTFFDIWGDFVERKLHPTASYFHGALTGRTLEYDEETGRRKPFEYLGHLHDERGKFAPGGGVVELVSPLFPKEVWDAYSKAGARGLVAAVPAFFGAGHQRYPARPEDAPVPAEVQKVYDELDLDPPGVGGSFAVRKGVKHDLTRREEQEYLDATRREAYRRLSKLFGDERWVRETWGRWDRARREKFVKRVHDEAREAARNKMKAPLNRAERERKGRVRLNAGN